MNYARLTAAAVVAWVVSLGVGYFVNEVLLAGVYAPNVAVMRPDADMGGLLPIGFVFLLVGFFAFAFAYAKGYEGGNGIAEGIRFGILIAIIVSCFGLIWQYVMFPITGGMAAAIIIDGLAEMALYGAIVGAIYKPAARQA